MVKLVVPLDLWSGERFPSSQVIESLISNDDNHPRHRRRYIASVVRSKFPDIDECVLHDLFGEFPAARYAKCYGEQGRNGQFVERLERNDVASRDAMKQLHEHGSVWIDEQSV